MQFVKSAPHLDELWAMLRYKLGGMDKPKPVGKVRMVSRTDGTDFVVVLGQAVIEYELRDRGKCRDALCTLRRFRNPCSRPLPEVRDGVPRRKPYSCEGHTFTPRPPIHT